MKPALILLLFLSSAAMLRGQIINGGFEDGMTGWASIGNVLDVNSHLGTYSFHYYGPDIIYTFLTNSPSLNPNGSGIPRGNYKITCWYKIVFEGEYNELVCTYILSNKGIRYSPNSKSLYKGREVKEWTKAQLSENFNFTDSSSRDSISLGFSLDINRGYAHFSFDLDDVNFEPIDNIVSKSNSVAFSFTISPNPISSHAHLNLHLNAPASIHAAIYDVTGREVLRLPSVESASGDERIPFDVDEIPNGVYYLRCEVGGNTTVEKIIVNH